MFLDEIDKAARSFNPTMVRLLPSYLTQSAPMVSTFNPTMVRLLPATPHARPPAGAFQSHNGAIAADNFDGTIWAQILLSIPQWCDCCCPNCDSFAVYDNSFNPTMVRLLHACLANSRSESLAFNPTMVRLLQLAWRMATQGLQAFNPTMVRLLRPYFWA